MTCSYCDKCGDLLPLPDIDGYSRCEHGCHEGVPGIKTAILDFAKMVKDPKGNKLLRDTFKSFLPDMFPEWDKNKVQEEIDKIVGEPREAK